MGRTSALPKCGAKTRQGGQCQRAAGAGTSHVGFGKCSNHGGASPNAELGGALTKARHELAVMGTPLAVHPIDAILQCVSIAAGEVAYATERIAELQAEEAVGPTITTRPLKREKGAESRTERTYEEGAPALHIWIRVRHDAMDRLSSYSKVALAAGVAERQVRLAEQQATLIATAVRNILTDLGVANRPDAPSIVRRHLTLIGQATQPQTIEHAQATPATLVA